MYRRDSPFHSDERSHAGTITPQFRSPEIILQDIRKRIQDAAKKQERLSKSRADLLAQRERARASSKIVQAKRSAAGDAEAAFMDYVRGFMNSATTPSFEMINLYNKVESARNTLGALEVDHQQLERNLSGADWMLKEEEDEFYQYALSELFEEVLVPSDRVDQNAAPPILLGPRQPPPPPPPPPPPVQHDTVLLQRPYSSPDRVPPPPRNPASSADLYLPSPVAESLLLHPAEAAPPVPRIIEPDLSSHQESTIELDGLGKQFPSIPHWEPNLQETRNLNMPDKDALLGPGGSPSPSSTIWASDQYSRGLSSNWLSETGSDATANDTHLAAKMSSIVRRLSDPSNYESTKLSIPQALERSFSEDATHTIHSGRAAKNRVRAWLMGVLEHNPMEKTLYHNILEAILRKNGFHYPDHEPWGIPATQFWARDSRSSFETDPLDKSSTTVETAQEPRHEDGPVLLLIDAQHSTSPSPDPTPHDTSIMSPDLPPNTETGQDQQMDSLPTVSPKGSVPDYRDEYKHEPRSALGSLNLDVPKITIVRPRDDESSILRHAVARPLPPSPVHLSCNPATLLQYRVDVQTGSEPTSFRNFFRDYMSPRWSRRSHSMSSLTRSRDATLKIKRTKSKDGA
jgi:hypothetical protein